MGMRKVGHLCIMPVVALSFMLAAEGALPAQQSAAAKTLMLVAPSGSGGIVLPSGPYWKLQQVTATIKASQHIVHVAYKQKALSTAFFLFTNVSAPITARKCLDGTVAEVLSQIDKASFQREDGESRNALGSAVETTSFLVDIGDGTQQHNLFAAIANANTCAVMQVASTTGQPAEDATLRASLSTFRPYLTYSPSSTDYFVMGSLLSRVAPDSAARYYKASLEKLPRTAEGIAMRRIETDQLVKSLVESGDLENSRAIAGQAIASDPTYPINYYNLACSDAELSNAAGAKLHLQQAFDRRANVIPGDKMPDPTTDSSLIKLKNDPAFWAYVQSLPKN
jgi:hypothetical protein